MPNKSLVLFCSWSGSIRSTARKVRIGCDVMPVLSIQEDGGTLAEQLVEQWLKRVGRP